MSAFTGLGFIQPPSPGHSAILRVRTERDFRDGRPASITEQVHEWEGYTAAAALAYRVQSYTETRRPFTRDGMTITTTRDDGWLETESITFEDPQEES